MSRVLSKAGEIDLIWSESDPESRAGLMLIAHGHSPDSLPSSARCLPAFANSIWEQDFSVCFDFGYDSTSTSWNRLSTCSTVFRTHGVVERGQ
jgi:hypothetical protein